MLIWVKVAIFWIFWTYAGTYFHWIIREHFRQRRLNARAKIWDVQAAWTGPELDPAASRPELPKAQGQRLSLPK